MAIKRSIFRLALGEAGLELETGRAPTGTALQIAPAPLVHYNSAFRKPRRIVEGLTSHLFGGSSVESRDSELNARVFDRA